VWSALFCWSLPASADPQAQSPSQVGDPDSSDAGQNPNYNGEDFTRPQTGVTTRLQYRTSSGTTSQTERGREMLQFNSKLDLAPGWKLGMLVQIPYIENTTTTFGDPAPENDAGLGDLVLQPSLINSIDKHWAYGFGARLVSPPSQESLGTDRWQIMPGVGVRYSFLEIGPDTYFVPVVRYAISFLGGGGGARRREPSVNLKSRRR
jgi:hypothetical protein